MLTRCPRCATTFRVTPEQLKARQGRVRCGACQEVFSALDTLIEEVLPPPDVAVETAPDTDLPEQAATETLAATEPQVEAEAPVEPELEAEPELDVEPEPEVAPEPEITPEPAEALEPIAATDLPAEPVLESESPVAPVLESPGEPAPETPAEPMPEPPAAPAPEPALHEEAPRRKWPWAVGMGIAALVFAAQAVVAFRTEIVVLYPEAKPALADLCATLGCELRLPRKAELVGIETSDLHPDADGRLTLVATLKNRAPFAQEYPHLELTLTDTGDQPLVRRVLAPAEYLLPQAPGAVGFGANAEIAVNLAVEAPGVPAAGYRLYLFYP